MDISTIKELIELLATRSDAWNTLWDIYKVVVVAVIGVVASGKILKDNRKAASIIAIIGFIIFSAGNYKALDEMRKQREALVSYVKNCVKAKHEEGNNSLLEEKISSDIISFANASLPPTSKKLKTYHWLLDVFVVLLLFFIPQFQKPAEEVASASQTT